MRKATISRQSFRNSLGPRDRLRSKMYEGHYVINVRRSERLALGLSGLMRPLLGNVRPAPDRLSVRRGTKASSEG